MKYVETEWYRNIRKAKKSIEDALKNITTYQVKIQYANGKGFRGTAQYDETQPTVDQIVLKQMRKKAEQVDKWPTWMKEGCGLEGMMKLAKTTSN